MDKTIAFFFVLLYKHGTSSLELNKDGNDGDFNQKYS
jgi:hypothetical protein